EAIGIIRREDNESLDVRIIAFFLKSSLIPKWVPIFVSKNILRFTGKYTLDENPSYDKLEIVANSGDLIDMNQENLPISSISTFVMGFATEPVQSDDELFKSIKILVTEFIKDKSSGKKFLIKCRYLKSDERIDKKLVRAKKSSNLMITGEILRNLHHSKKQTNEHKKRFIPRPTQKLRH
ncbi:1403_t:CDS:2, partial [Funneliformis caledonium]